MKTEDSEPVREAGWYADPFERLRFRWWDGEQWTAYATGADSAVQWDELPTDEEPQPNAPRGVGIAVAGYLVGVALGSGIAAALSAADRPGGRVVALVTSQFGLWGALLLACLFVSKRRGDGSFAADYGWRFRRIDIGLGFAGSFVCRIVAGITVAPIPIPARSVRAPDRPIVERLTDGQWDWVVVVLIVCIGAPVIEELFFRGLLQSRLVAIAGAPVGIVITSILFGAAHLVAWEGSITLVYGLAIAGGGIVLGLMRQLTGRLGPSVMAHAFFNAQAVLASALLS